MINKGLTFLSLAATLFILSGAFFVLADRALAASLSLSPASGSYALGDTFELRVILDTQGVETDGVDLHYLRFDQSVLKINSAGPGTLYGNTLTDMIDNNSGTYDFSQTALGGSHYNGSGTLVSLTFEVLGSGTGNIAFDYTSGSSLDCNVAAAGSDILSGVTNGIYTLTGPPDTTAPAAVTDLTTSNPTGGSVRLTWTAPGDDASTGTATSYDVRYATSQITGSNWDSASQASEEPSPQAAGLSESFRVSGLNSDTRYYFAIKTSDEVPNTSAISNSPSAVTMDITAPAAVTDLTASSPGQDSITLTWTAPGDDGASGAAATYDIRYNYGQITEDNWASASQATGEPVPQTAGSSESFVITDLDSGTVYYFAIRTADEVPNWSGISNSSSGTTTGPPDETAPAAVTDLAVSNPTGNSLSLAWTAPGDNGNTGTAVSYDIRYSTSEITEDNWASATGATGEPTPQVAGSSESFVVGGLNPNTTYYFVLKTSDEVPNISSISNAPSGTTTEVADINAPVISDVAASGITNIGVTITWATDEPATSQVEYGTSTGYGQTTALDANLVTSHVVSWTTLSAATTYHYRVRSKDAADNEAISGDHTFTTTGGSDNGGNGGNGGNGNGTKPYADGSLLRGPDGKVYLIESQQKRWIISLEAFDSCNYNWTLVISVSQDVLNQYPNGYNFHGCAHEITLLKTADNPAVYQISKNTKRHLPSIEVFESYGYPWTDIQVVSQAQLDAYPRTELIRTETSDKTYYFSETRTRRWIPTVPIFDAYSFDWGKVIIINDTEMAVYPDCRVIKLADNPDVYQLSDATKRKITSIDAYNTLGYRWEDINIVNQTEFNFYVTGQPYSI